MRKDNTDSELQVKSPSWLWAQLRRLGSVAILATRALTWTYGHLVAAWVVLASSASYGVDSLRRYSYVALNPTQRRAAMQDRWFFWRARRFGAKIRFRTFALLIRGRNSLSAKISTGRLFGEFVRLSLGNIALSIFIVLGCLSLDQLLLTHTQSWKEWFGAYYTASDYSIYSSFLGTLAGVSGVFLGLYFTAVSVVASTGYATAPPNLRSLILREHAGSVYVTFVVRLGSMSPTEHPTDGLVLPGQRSVTHVGQGPQNFRYSGNPGG